jgi:hypothetical protein
MTMAWCASRLRATVATLAATILVLVVPGAARGATDVSTVGVVRPESSNTKLGWHLRNSNSSGGAHIHFQFGNPKTDDFPLAGDWNGDGRDTIAVARPESSGTKLGWHLRNSNSTGGADIHFTFGHPETGFPVVGDWNGDGKDTIGVVKDEAGRLGWNLRNSNSTGGTHVHFTYGTVGQGYPVVGDWNGDGKDTIGVVRNDGFNHFEWHLRNTNTSGGANVKFTFGSIGDFPVVGDWNGDGKDTIGVVRDDTLGNLEWNLRNSNSNGGADKRFTYGSATTGFPVTGDWNG